MKQYFDKMHHGTNSSFFLRWCSGIWSCSLDLHEHKSVPEFLPAYCSSSTQCELNIAQHLGQVLKKPQDIPLFH